MRDRLMEAMENLENEGRRLATFERTLEEMSKTDTDMAFLKRLELDVTRQRARLNAASDRLRKVMRGI